MRYFILFFSLTLSVATAAQNSATFRLPDVAANSGTTVCLPVTVDNFTGGILFSFALNTDVDGALTFNRVQNLNPDVSNFGMEDFNLTDFLFQGIITVEWQNFGATEDCSSAPGVVTLPDRAVLFEVCYDVDGITASNHPVEFYDKPDSVPFDGMDDSVPVVFNKRAQCNQSNDAYPEIIPGSVTVGVAPLVLEIEPFIGNSQPGDIVCTDIKVISGFTDLTGFQFGIVFDSTVLRTMTVAPNRDLPQNVPSNYFIFGGASFYATWAPFGNVVHSLDDGSTLANVCFEVVGECGQSTDLTIDELPRDEGGPRPVEASGASADLVVIPIIGMNTVFAIDNCNPDGFDVEIGCPAGNPSFGDTEVCIEVRAGDDFEEMTDMDYSISWNPNILEFTNIGFRNPSLLIDPADDFILDQTGQGLLFFDWDARFPAGNSLDPGEVVFTMCFNVIGFGGLSPIAVSNFRNDIKSNSLGTFNGVNPTNCTVAVDRPPGVAVRFPDSGPRSSEDRCFEMLVDGFDEVRDFTLNVRTSPALFEFSSATSAVVGVSIFELAPGIVQLTYEGPVLDLPNGTALVSLCYRALMTAEPGTCDSIRLADFLDNEVITVESAGMSVPIQESPGDMCVLFPNGFGINIQDTASFLDTTFCVPVSVNNFMDIETAELLFRFDPSRVTFEELNLTSSNWPGLSMDNFDLTRVDIGIITLSFNSGGPGVSSPTGDDETEVFEFCFRSLRREGCFDLTAEPNAEPATSTSEGDGSIVVNNGNICINDRILVLSIETVDATCSTVADGEIIYTVEPREDGEPVFIRTSNPVRFSSTGRVTGLLPGVQNYTLYTPGGDVQTSGTITIGVDPESAAVADAGPDVFFSCTGSMNALLVSRNNVGETYRLSYLNLDGSRRFLSEGTIASSGNASIIVSEIGLHQLEVTSASGCTALDTVEVFGPTNPMAEAGDNLSIDCANESVILDASASSQGANVRYVWERVDLAGNVLEEVSRSMMFETSQTGRYRLTVTFADLQCTSTDSVNVFNDVFFPTSELPTQVELDCDGSAATLSVGDFDDNIAYTWAELEQGLNFPLSSSNIYFTNQTGDYIVELIDRTNSCVRVDTVSVIPSTGTPGVLAPEFLTANCDPDTTLIEPLYQNVTATTRYDWSTVDGSFVISTSNEPSLLALEPGTYQIIVSNGSCADTSQLLLGESVGPTSVDAGSDQTLGCDSSVTLDGSATDALGRELDYQWTRDGFGVAMGNAQVIVTDQPGEYVLTVTIVGSGCTGTDTVTVFAPDGFPVYNLADTIGSLGCEPDTVTISVTDPASGSYTYVWNDPTGNQISQTMTAEATTSGIYTVTITNPATNCLAVDQVFVDEDTSDRPNVGFSQSGTILTCESPSITLDASLSSSGPNFVYEWEAVEGGEDVSDETGAVIEISSPGTYRLSIRNTNTNCTASRDIVIGEDRMLPNVEINTVTALDCENRSTLQSIQILDQPNDYSIVWTNPFMIDFPRDTTVIEVTRGGTYSAVVSNPTTSCVTIATIMVPDFADSLATIVISEPDSFDCNNSSITLDASASIQPNQATDIITWTSLNGNTVTPPAGSLIVSVNGPGEYILTIDNDAGCSTSDTVLVAAAANTPFADAGPDQEITCGDMPQLDGSNSTPPPGPSILYTWSSLSGAEVISGVNDVMPFVSGVGVYQLIVTNLENGCTDTSRVNVLINEGERALLPADFSICSGDTSVVGNLPEGTTGVFTSFNDEGAEFIITDSLVSITEVADGLSLVWTLSQEGCPDYSADTIRISPQTAPVASNDVLELVGERNTGSINVLDNDVRSGPVTVTLTNEPEFGEILSNLNGDFTFQVPLGLTQTTTIGYEVCSNICPDLCSTATLTIIADAAGTDPQVYNAITPNGDGRNDIFVFELLDQGGTAYPDREFIVFNRWGDIVFERSPYANDWGGTNNRGDELPEGTYYYILRLNVGEGDIIRGDVTIIR